MILVIHILLESLVLFYILGFSIKLVTFDTEKRQRRHARIVDVMSENNWPYLVYLFFILFLVAFDRSHFVSPCVGLQQPVCPR